MTSQEHKVNEHTPRSHRNAGLTDVGHSDLRQLGVVIPALDAASTLPATLVALAAEARLGEILVVDGGSVDATAPLAAAGGARVLHAPRGRGSQIAAGVAAGAAPWLLLLHADTVLAPGWANIVARFIAAPGNRDRAGFFRFTLDSQHPAARRLERAVAWRCRALALPYGDQGLLIARDLLAALGGMRSLPLMEDVDLVRRLGRARLVALDHAAVTAATRFERSGWHRRSAMNITCLMLYHLGLPPRLIARLYG